MGLAWGLQPVATERTAVLQKTKCDIHTFDCTYNGTSLDGNKRHFYHKIWYGMRRARSIVIRRGLLAAAAFCHMSSSGIPHSL